MVLRLILLIGISLFGQKTDSALYTIPSPPTLPSAGGTYVDPVFGTTIMRITDASTDTATAYCYHDYSYYDAFSPVDNRRIQIQCEDPTNGGNKQRYWFDFDPINFTLGTKHAFPLDPGGRQISNDGTAQWSDIYPHILFVNGVTPMKLYQYNVLTDTFTVIKDFTGMSGMPAGTTSIATMSKDRNDRFFSWTTNSVSGANGCFMWDRNNPSAAVYAFDQSYQLNTHNCGVDPTGRYFKLSLDVYDPNPPQSGNQIEIYDRVQGTIKKYNSLAPQWGINGHSAMFPGGMAGSNGGFDSPYGALIYRYFADANTVYTLLTPLNDGADHTTCSWYDIGWCGQEKYRSDGTDGYPWNVRSEVFLVSTDAKQRLLRLAHHHSQPDQGGTDGYRSQPQFVISRDGQFGTFNSNMGNKNGRIDVYVVRLKIAPTTPSGTFHF